MTKLGHTLSAKTTFGQNLLFGTLPAIGISLIVLEATFRFVIPASEMPYYYFAQEDRIMSYAVMESLYGQPLGSTACQMENLAA